MSEIQNGPIKNYKTIEIMEQKENPPTNATNNWKNPSCLQIFYGVLIVIGITITWTGSTQFSKSSLTDPDRFYAPYFMVWFSTCWMTMCFPVYMFYCWPIILKGRQTLTGTIHDAGLVYGDGGMALLPILIRTTPFVVLWIIANYSYSQSLGHISAAETTAIFSSNPAFVYILGLIVLKDKLLPMPILAIIIATAGIVLMAYSQGFGTFYFTGIICALIASIFAAIYKVLFKKIVGDANLGQVSLFMTSLGFCNLILSAPIMLGLALGAVETIIWYDMPWEFLCGSAVLSLIFNFLINFGISFSHPLFISVGFFLGMPLNGVVDAIVRDITFDLYEIIGGICILVSFILLAIPSPKWCNRETERPRQDSKTKLTYRSTETPIDMKL